MATTLQCAQCGHENESERIYCHNCGVKLDRALLPQDDKKAAEVGPKAQKRVRKLTNPPKIHVGQLIKSIVSTFFWAALIAAAIQMARAPDGAPAANSEELIDAPFIGIELEQAAEAPRPQRLAYTEDDVNGYLRNTIRPKKGGGGIAGDSIQFGGAFVDFREGQVATHMSQRLFDYPFYASAIYRVATEQDQIAAKNEGGAIGRLPIHPMIMQHADMMFSPVWEALKREKKSVGEMQSIAFHDKQVVMVTKPRAAQ